MKKIFPVFTVLFLIFCFSACSENKAPENITQSSQTTSQTAVPDITSVSIGETMSTAPADSSASETTPPTEATTAGSDTSTELRQPEGTETTSAPAEETTSADAQSESTATPVTQPGKAEILQMLSDAVNKTKSYSSSITVAHKEAFDIVEPVVTLDKAEAISGLVTKAVNFVKDLVLKPSSETYQFSGGTATTSEGESTQLLLPKDKSFSLTADAVASASVKDENGMKHIVLTLAPEETHSLAEIPQNHSNSIGYLDLDGSFKIIQIDEIVIKYPGSVIDAYIRADGYVQSVTYTINLEAYSKAHGLGISGSAAFSGSQTEEWSINW